jgi:pyridinium-3,5-biscarboxylic acid mononucleotide sulfurtransferase
MSYTAARMENNLLTTIQEAAPVEDAAALAKQDELLDRLRGEKSLLVAFSGGADSAYLAWAANRALGEQALAITALSPSFSHYDREQAEAFVAVTGLRYEFVETREFENPLYGANGADRCYHCKDELFLRMEALAQERKFRSIAYGINLDDTHDFRPGHRAAREHRILAPLLDAGLCKAEVRWLSRRANLPTWDRPASACLSSRVPYGTAVTPELLERIEQAEAALRELGFRQLRVRAHGELARIELALDELPRGIELGVAAKVAPRFKDLGFTSVTLDPEGYRQGSLNALLRNK